MKSFKKSNTGKKIRAAKTASAAIAIGKLEKNTDTFILTYGQFSLIDALIAILAQTGPAHVTISTWTAAHAHLDKSAELMEGADILSLRMIVDRSFKTRQPKYFQHMIEIFGQDSIREMRTHAKFMTIKNDTWNIVVRTSMNLNENPRLENIEISDNEAFCDFFEKIADDIFAQDSVETLPDLPSIPDEPTFKKLHAPVLNTTKLKEPSYATTIDN